jgi:folylpolyglutamate synthase/dihydropteroate synthase
VVGDWCCVDTHGARGRRAGAMAEIVRAAGGRVAGEWPGVEAAIAALRRTARPGERVLVLGSFSLVGPALEHLVAVTT